MSLTGGFGSIIFGMVINMDETRLQTVSQLQAFVADALGLEHWIDPFPEESTNDTHIEAGFKVQSLLSTVFS